MAEVTSVHAVAPGDSSGSAAGAFATLREGVPLSHSLLINSHTSLLINNRKGDTCFIEKRDYISTCFSFPLSIRGIMKILALMRTFFFQSL